MSQALNIATLPLHGRRLIEASAGTGKTFTLAALYVRLVLGHGADSAYPRPLMPPEILVVTFTEAATEELRTRIRARLKEARDALLGRSAPDRVLAELLAEVPDALRERYASRLDGAARLMDDAAIFTIHGFCQRMLKRHAFDSGSLFAAELVSDVQGLFDAAVEDYWRRMFYPLSTTLQALLAGFWPTPKALGDAVAPLLIGGRAQPLLWGGELIEAPASLEEVLAPCERAQAELERQAARARALWREQGETIAALLRDAVAGGQLKANVFKPADLDAKLESLEQWCSGGEAALDGALLDSKKQPWCGQARLDGAVKKGGACPRHDFFAVLDELSATLVDQPDPRPQLLAHCRDALAVALAAEKRRRGVWDFDDLLNGLDDALAGSAGGRLAARIRRELPVAMIDEFQDTDPVQYRIFSTIYRDQGEAPGREQERCALLMIGDPKQAIYAFRGADIHTYLVARRATEARSRFTLGRNFRSTQAMVEAVNRLFQCSRRPFRFDDIPFEPVEAQGRGERLVVDGRDVPALTCWLPDGNGSVKKHDYAAWMSEATRADIQALLEGGAAGRSGFIRDDGGLRPVRPADIAVLVRTGREAELIRDALSRAGIKSVYLSQKASVFASREAFHLLQLFEAVAHPRDDRSLRAALATRLLTDSLAEVARIEEDELAWEAMVERFGAYHRQWQRFGVLPMLRAVMRDFRIGERLLARPDGERRLTDLLHLGELAQAASQRLDGEQALLRWLHRALAGRFEQGLDPQALIQRLESDETLVRVVTIHKSKGLQYPIVYLPFICDYREIDHRTTAFRLAHERHGRAMALAPDGEQRQAADEERLAEDLRLLYVALTRAEFACRLGVAPLFKGKLPKDAEEGATTLARSALGALLAESLDGEALTARTLRRCLEALVSDGVIAVAPPPQAAPRALAPAEESEAACRARRFDGRVDRAWWIASYTALIEGARQPFEAGQAAGAVTIGELPDAQLGLDIEVLEETTPVPRPPVRTLADFPRGPRAGTFLHALLEAVDFDRLGSDEFYADELRRLVASRIGYSSFDDGWAPVLGDWLCHSLPAPLHAAVPGLSLARLAAWKTELEFWLPASNAWSTRLDALVQRFEPLPGRRAALAPRRLEGMLKGYIDMVFEADGRWYLLDWKSNYLGDNPADYSDAAMAEAVVDHRYDLQYVLYTLALHRLLRARLPDYAYERHFGGVFYVFMRGMTAAGGSGVFHRRPARALIETLDAWLDGNDEAIIATPDDASVADHA